MNMLNARQMIALTVATALLAGCAAPGGPGGPGGANAQDQDPCSVGSSAAAGAVVGALLGAMVNGKNGALAGAALGGAAGGLGCYAVNVRHRQLRTAAQTDQDYVRAKGALPAQPQVVSYTSQVSNSVVERGKPFTVSSTTELVNGRTEPVSDVREELVLLDPQGKPFKNGSKPLENKSNSGGRFQNSFELKLPQGVSQGTYAMKTNLYVNGKLSATRDLQTQLVIREDGAMQLASR